MGAAYYADPLRRSLTGMVTAVLAALTIAAGAYFAISATRGVTDPRPEMRQTLDRLVLPSGATLLEERQGGGVACDDMGCPTVERWWILSAPVEEACPAVRLAIGDWGGIRFQELGTAPCGYLGVLGKNRLSFSVADPLRARLPRQVTSPDSGSPHSGSIVHVSLTRTPLGRDFADAPGAS